MGQGQDLLDIKYTRLSIIFMPNRSLFHFYIRKSLSRQYFLDIQYFIPSCCCRKIRLVNDVLSETSCNKLTLYIDNDIDGIFTKLIYIQGYIFPQNFTNFITVFSSPKPPPNLRNWREYIIIINLV